MVAIDSEKDRYADVLYTVAFLRTNDTAPRAEGSALISVMNADISDDMLPEEPLVAVTEGVSEEETAGETVTEETLVEEIVVEETPVPPTPPVTPQFEQEFIYAIPTSDPNGRTDLSVRFLAAGDIIGNTFFAGPLVAEENGAIQFEVKNFGTKTSNEWDFEIEMPNGSTYESGDMSPLKPNERAVLTIGFTAADVSEHDFIVTVDTVGDQNGRNDTFVETLPFSG